MKDIRELARAKRAEMDTYKKERDSIKAENVNLKCNKDKQDKLAKVVKKLTQSEFDALPKALQKEVEYFK